MAHVNIVPSAFYYPSNYKLIGAIKELPDDFKVFEMSSLDCTLDYSYIGLCDDVPTFTDQSAEWSTNTPNLSIQLKSDAVHEAVSNPNLSICDYLDDSVLQNISNLHNDIVANIHSTSNNFSNVSFTCKISTHEVIIYNFNRCIFNFIFS